MCDLFQLVLDWIGHHIAFLPNQQHVQYEYVRTSRRLMLVCDAIVVTLTIFFTTTHPSYPIAISNHAASPSSFTGASTVQYCAVQKPYWNRGIRVWCVSYEGTILSIKGYLVHKFPYPYSSRRRWWECELRRGVELPSQGSDRNYILLLTYFVSKSSDIAKARLASLYHGKHRMIRKSLE
jgi:hypothetical protein